MFRTEVQLERSKQKIYLRNPIVALGSCFAQHIGQRLADFKFNVSVNPFGTLFNPVSMFKLVRMALRGDAFSPEGLVESQGIFHHFDLHSDLSSMSDRILLKNADRLLEQLGSEFRRASWIIYTLGTSIVYELNESGEIVANCHKVPANRFTRRFLNLDEITEAFNTQYRLIKEINSETKFILTVSPVRHQKESFQQNNLSKSILRVAIEEILNSHEDVQYFPAFEIMMDELRDYRFYESDMLHPNEVAGDYIWQKFQEVYFDEQVRIFIEKWAKVRKAMAHRPFNRRSPQHQEFIRKTIQKVNEFRKEVDVHRELELLNAQLL